MNRKCRPFHISVLIPTFRRTEVLNKVLNALLIQTVLPDEILCGVRDIDWETRDFLSHFESPIPIKTICVDRPGQIHSLQSCLNCSTGDLVCFFDDDAEPQATWLEMAQDLFLSDDKIGAVGGRDLLQDRPAQRQLEPTCQQVGRITWYGKRYGNHHRGRGEARSVDTLKGCNMAFRGNLARKLGFDYNLKGEGAQPHNDLAFCLDIKNAGYRVIYHPALQVIHHVAPRHDNDTNHRGTFNEKGVQTMLWNQSYAYATRLHPVHWLMCTLWLLLIGEGACLGFAKWLLALTRGEKNATKRFFINLRTPRFHQRTTPK